MVRENKASWKANYFTKVVVSYRFNEIKKKNERLRL